MRHVTVYRHQRFEGRPSEQGRKVNYPQPNFLVRIVIGVFEFFGFIVVPPTKVRRRPCPRFRPNAYITEVAR